MVSKIKDEIKPMFIFNAKYRNDSIGSVENLDVMTPSFINGWQSEREQNSHCSRESVGSIMYYGDEIDRSKMIQLDEFIPPAEREKY